MLAAIGKKTGETHTLDTSGPQIGDAASGRSYVIPRVKMTTKLRDYVLSNPWKLLGIPLAAGGLGAALAAQQGGGQGEES
jgi:hypothetical protein